MIAIIEMIKDENIINKYLRRELIDKKKIKVLRYMDYAKMVGRLETVRGDKNVI